MIARARAPSCVRAVSAAPPSVSRRDAAATVGHCTTRHRHRHRHTTPHRDTRRPRPEAVETCGSELCRHGLRNQRALRAGRPPAVRGHQHVRRRTGPNHHSDNIRGRFPGEGGDHRRRVTHTGTRHIFTGPR